MPPARQRIEQRTYEMIKEGIRAVLLRFGADFLNVGPLEDLRAYRRTTEELLSLPTLYRGLSQRMTVMFLPEWRGLEEVAPNEC
jgi:hypothetical protein